MINMTLAPGSGLFADVADFTGNLLVTANYAGKSVEMVTTSKVNPSYLSILSLAVNELKPADGGDENTALPLTATYGYAIDLAFRCNAAQPDLVLQTAGVQRVYSGEEFDEEDLSGSTQGGGSYMEFTSSDDEFTLEQQLALMDAIRVGFIDDQGGILAIAKLNVTSKEVSGDVVKAPLYLYEYEFVQDDVSDGMILEMGQRRFLNNQITPLEQNVAKAVTAVVWLDGDTVDNTMVSAKAATSLDGVLNLQFATSAELIAATEDSVMHYAADQSGLEQAVTAAKELSDKGQGKYTNASWKSFTSAYRRAQAVNDNPMASQIEIRNAVALLAEATKELDTVDVATLSAIASKARTEYLGMDEKVVGAYIIETEEEGYVVKTEGTEAEIAKWKNENKGTINSVNHELNKRDVGNGVFTAIYTDDSWNAYARALYQAEGIAMNADATEDEINAAVTALADAEKALEFAVYYVPYEYNGNLFYMDLSQKEATDTYGRWYDSSFKQIYDDVTILKLDAYAKEGAITQIGQAASITNEAETITPDIAFLTEVFPELRNMEVKAVHWDEVDSALFTKKSSGEENKEEESQKVGLPSFSSGDFVYNVEYPGITLNLTGSTGETTIGALILTQNGVVTRVSKAITIYDAADSAKISGSVESVKVGGTVDVSVALEGGNEPIKSYTWASTDQAVATVTGGSTATVTAVAAGNTTIKVTVTTECGNNFTTEFVLKVTE